MFRFAKNWLPSIVIEHDEVLAPTRPPSEIGRPDTWRGGFEEIRPGRRVVAKGGPRPVVRPHERAHLSSARKEIQCGVRCADCHSSLCEQAHACSSGWVCNGECHGVLQHPQ
jgi:hypothetical protein